MIIHAKCKPVHRYNCPPKFFYVRNLLAVTLFDHVKFDPDFALDGGCPFDWCAVNRGERFNKILIGVGASSGWSVEVSVLRVHGGWSEVGKSLGECEAAIKTGNSKECHVRIGIGWQIPLLVDGCHFLD